MNQVCLVTGSEGFIGKALVSRLRMQEGFDVIEISKQATLLNGDPIHPISLLDSQEVSNLLSRFKPQYVFHLAAKSSVVRSWDDPVHTMQYNLEITQNLVRSILSESPESRTVYFSSSAVYARSNQLISEDNYLGPDTPYGMSKLISEMAISSLSSYVILRPFAIVGFQKKNDLLDDWISQILLIQDGKKNTLEVGNLEIIRDFIFIDDAIDKIIQISRLEKDSDIYNLCSGQSVRLQDLLAELVTVSGIHNFRLIENSASRIRLIDREYLVGNVKKLNNSTQSTTSFERLDFLRLIYRYRLENYRLRL